ncbi:hypothetical protein M5689_020723 [Euphorbia peplus]|nr:hypothetical protein M5689_020723 [Euphorbia peplus]
MCETTLFLTDGTKELIEEKKFDGASCISEVLAMDNVVLQCLRYLSDEKNVTFMDYNYDALVEKRKSVDRFDEP